MTAVAIQYPVRRAKEAGDTPERGTAVPAGTSLNMGYGIDRSARGAGTGTSSYRLNRFSVPAAVPGRRCITFFFF
eukprot:SAG31_NODE_886_length_11229_cov_19.134142_8_plen_75_part_00